MPRRTEAPFGIAPLDQHDTLLIYCMCSKVPKTLFRRGA
ncbi:MAG: hypothetical protein [Siphoviridae sp. ctvD11]|nr:MAG: hypothetical protein [Siphoviridae sp. ctvD11]